MAQVASCSSPSRVRDGTLQPSKSPHRPRLDGQRRGVELRLERVPLGAHRRQRAVQQAAQRDVRLAAPRSCAQAELGWL